MSIGSQAVQQAAELDELLALGTRAALGGAALDAAEVRARGACRDEDHEIVGCLGSRSDAIQELFGLVDVVATDHLDITEVSSDHGCALLVARHGAARLDAQVRQRHVCGADAVKEGQKHELDTLHAQDLVEFVGLDGLVRHPVVLAGRVDPHAVCRGAVLAGPRRGHAAEDWLPRGPSSGFGLGCPEALGLGLTRAGEHGRFAPGRIAHAGRRERSTRAGRHERHTCAGRRDRGLRRAGRHERGAGGLRIAVTLFGVTRFGSGELVPERAGIVVRRWGRCCPLL